jgi:predicted permease
MLRFRPLVAKFRATFSRSRNDAELNEEIETHLALLSAALIARGISPEEAHLAARREFGGIEQTKQTYREARGMTRLENLFQDLRLSLRSLRKNPGFAAIAIGSLAIGIGANTSMFSIVQALEFRALPIPEPRQLVQVRSFSPQAKTYADNFAYPFVRELANTGLFRSTAAMFPTTVSLSTTGKITQVPGELVTGDYFRTLAVQPILGRLLGPEDMRHPGADTVCVISYSLWQSRFAGSKDVLSQSVLLDGRRFQIVGVTAKGFQGSVLYWPHEIQIPVSMTAAFMDGFPWQSANSTYLYLFARLQPGITLAAADARLKVIGPQVGAKIRNPKNPDQTARWNRFSLVPASQGPGLQEDKTLQVSLVSGIVFLTLLIACANIACLLLARASAQERETAVQISLGAPQSRIIERYVVESLLLAAGGGIAGFIASRWIAQLFTYVLQVGYLNVRPDTGMLLFSLAACAGTALLFGFIPGWQASRVKARFVGFREHGSARTTRRENLFRRGLVSLQIALSTVLLVGCTLSLRSLQKIQSVALGFDPNHVLMIDLDPSRAGRSQAESLAIYRQVLDRVRLLPGVESATLGYGAPLSGFTFNTSFASSRITDAKVPDRVVPSAIVAGGLFQTFHISLLRGRDFTDSDLHQPRSIIVNRAFVDYYHLGDRAVGKRLQFDRDQPSLEIIGVVANTKMESAREEEATPAMFIPLTDDSRGQFSLFVRARGATDSLFREIRTVVESVDPQTPVTGENRLDDKVAAQYFDQRAIASLCSGFGAFALLLSCMGIYGVAAYAISRRTQEIGVRVALGALRTDVAALFLRETCWISAIGLAIGIPAALALASFVRTLLFGVEPGDPVTLSISAMTLSAVCLAAAALPLRDAFRVDPAEALRGE